MCIRDRVGPGKLWVGGDTLLPKLSSLGPVCGHISRAANQWPALTARLAHGLGTPGDVAALTQALAHNKEAGGLIAMKNALGFGCRMPLDVPRKSAP